MSDTVTTIDGAVDGYKLIPGVLESNETKEFNLRLWMHSDVTSSDEDSMNASYEGKISIIASIYEDNRGKAMAQALMEVNSYASGISRVIIEPKETNLFWDVSEAKDGSVMIYLVPEDNGGDTLYLQGNGGVIAPEDCSYFFLIC